MAYRTARSLTRDEIDRARSKLARVWDKISDSKKKLDGWAGKSSDESWVTRNYTLQAILDEAQSILNDVDAAISYRE